jgi:hypothetical protein
MFRGYGDHLETFSLENWPEALLMVADESRNAVVEILLYKGADMNIRDDNGNLALDLIIKNIKKNKKYDWKFGPPCCIRTPGLLLRVGADTADLIGKIKDIFPKFARNGSVDVWRALDCRRLHVFGDPALSSKALAWAASDGQLDKIHYLGGKHVPLSGTVKSAVLAAMKHRADRMPTIEALVSITPPLPSDGNEKADDKHDMEPLAVASSKGYTEVVAMLLQNFRHSTSVAKEALRGAIRCGHVECARLILDPQKLAASGTT